MTQPVDFGYDNATTSWEQARIALLFVCGHPIDDVGRASGPGAVLDASRYIELFEMQLGESPLAPGACSQILDGDMPVADAVHWATEAVRQRKFPLLVTPDRRTTPQVCNGPTVALWGKAGRPEIDEATAFDNHPTVIAGVRAATTAAFQSVPGNVTILTAQGVKQSPELISQATADFNEPVHLCIDLDVLTPGVLLNSRSIEPGGLDWYELAAAMEAVAAGPGVRSIDVTGTGDVSPRTPAASLCAQIVLRASALFDIPPARGR